MQLYQSSSTILACSLLFFNLVASEYLWTDRLQTKVDNVDTACKKINEDIKKNVKGNEKPDGTLIQSVDEVNANLAIVRSEVIEIFGNMYGSENRESKALNEKLEGPLERQKYLERKVNELVPNRVGKSRLFKKRQTAHQNYMSKVRWLEMNYRQDGEDLLNDHKRFREKALERDARFLKRNDVITKYTGNILRMSGQRYRRLRRKRYMKHKQLLKELRDKNAPNSATTFKRMKAYRAMADKEYRDHSRNNVKPLKLALNDKTEDFHRNIHMASIALEAINSCDSSLRTSLRKYHEHHTGKAIKMENKVDMDVNSDTISENESGPWSISDSDEDVDEDVDGEVNFDEE